MALLFIAHNPQAGQAAAAAAFLPFLRRLVANQMILTTGTFRHRHPRGRMPEKYWLTGSAPIDTGTRMRRFRAAKPGAPPLTVAWWASTYRCRGAPVQRPEYMFSGSSDADRAGIHPSLCSPPISIGVWTYQAVAGGWGSVPSAATGASPSGCLIANEDVLRLFPSALAT